MKYEAQGNYNETTSRTENRPSRNMFFTSDNTGVR